jgi:hypothetical protein
MNPTFSYPPFHSPSEGMRDVGWVKGRIRSYEKKGRTYINFITKRDLTDNRLLTKND